MVALLCFCCDHRNPAGAKFCNACGTSIHLKPCKHCEAINPRAAAHCHQCGEAFAFEFPAPLETASPDNGSAAVEMHSVVDPVGAPPQTSRRHAIRTRAAAILLGLTATVMLSAYYAYRHSGGESAVSVVIQQPVLSNPASQIPQGEAESVPEAPAPPAIAMPAAAPSSPGSVVGPADAPAGAALRRAASSKRPEIPSRAVAKANFPKLNPKLERGNPGSTANDVPRLTRDGDLVAVQQTVRTSHPPIPAADRAPVQRPRDSARRTTPATAGSNRPCAEGVALERTCDVRMMAKGN